ncbi:MAG: hypothetical protein OXB92_09125 [Acidimicrobiaceae bacterium]|nr:hypothetical protein [Acidimicrobiia bacterium]MCY4494001.1 hypothetical protein [Acidimicrobiaceae bacterium]
MTEPTNDDYDHIAEPLAAWLAGHLDDATHIEVGAFDRPGGGYSAETLIVPVTVTTRSSTEQHTIVLRRETPEPPVYPVQVKVGRKTLVATTAVLMLVPILNHAPNSRWRSKPLIYIDSL